MSTLVNGPSKPTSIELTAADQMTVKKDVILTNGDVTPVVSPARPGTMNGGHTMKPGFLVSFMVDARGGMHRGRRHSGVDVIIPSNRLCMPTRITCKLMKKEKAQSLPQLKDGETLASRILETGPAGVKFIGAVQIELPHFASLRDGEREVIILRSDNGLAWYEHKNLALVESNTDSEEPSGSPRLVAHISTADFPRYFAAVTRVRIDSKPIGSTGGSLQSSVIPQVQTVLPPRSINKEIIIGLQVLAINNDILRKTLGRVIPVSPVATIEPRRRRFHEPITLTIPIPKGATLPNPKTPTAVPALKLLYSISGGASPPKWEDITGSANLNIVNQCLSFATTVSARFWLLDCINVSEPIKAATEIYDESIVPPFLAQFHVFIKRHSATEAQVRVLCLTDEDVDRTFEAHEHFEEISRSQEPIEMLEGKPYYMNIEGDVTLAAANSVIQPYLVFHSFRVNRLSFIARCSADQISSGTLSFSKQPMAAGSVEAVRGTVCTLPLVLAPSEGGLELLSPEKESELYDRRFNAAASAAAAAAAAAHATINGAEVEARPTIGGLAGLRLAAVAKSLHGDWVPLASQLGITQREIVKIQSEFTDTEDQAMIMLHLWAEKAGSRATSSELEKALQRIGRDDLLAANLEKRAPVVPDLAQTPESDHLNPIDSPLNPNDGGLPVLDLDASTDRSVLFDAEPGAEYELEQVWDGTQWHKTKKIIPSSNPSSNTEYNAELEREHNPELDRAGVDVEPKNEEHDEIKQVIVPSTNASNDLLENNLSQDSHQDGVQESSHQEEDPKPGQHDVEKSSDIEHAEKVEPLVQEKGVDLNFEASLNHPDELEVKTDGDNLKFGSHPDMLEDDALTVEPQGLDKPVVEFESRSNEPGVMIESHSNESGVNVDSQPSKQEAEIEAELHDGGVKTEVQEFEEVLDDGTIVKRKITKTVQAQPSLILTTPDGTCLTDEGVFENFTTEFDENEGSTDGTVNTEVEETEETMEDGTIVKRRVIKTKQVISNVAISQDEGSEL